MHDFVVVWSERALLLRGLGNTILLSLAATIVAFALGALVAVVLMSSKPYRRLFAGFVDAMRCVPFLLFAYIVYYGLPSLGIRLDNWTSGLIALTAYNAAYMAKILRGTGTAQPGEPIEAGIAFGFS